jgi:hypothetical protein
LQGRWQEAAPYAQAIAEHADRLPAYSRVHTLWLEVAALSRAREPALAGATVAAFKNVAGSSPRYQVVLLRAESALAHDPTTAAALKRQAATLAARLRLPLVLADLRA